MDEMLNPAQLEEDAIYLGILTARGIKPLSRLEYFVKPHILDILKDLELIIVPITRFAEDGMKVRHFIIGKNQNIIEQYIAEFEGTVLQEKIPSIVRSDAMYFGYPECCAEAYIKELYTSNNICNEEKSLLFHYACPGCKETPRLIPLYKSALLEARHLFKKIPSFNKD